MEHDIPHEHCLQIPAHLKASLRIMLLAKHACGDGGHDRVDGNHAVYHHELRRTLEKIGLDVVTANRFDALFSAPDVDFVFPLLNRAGFLNSEMLAPLLLQRLGIPYLGASPILRGLSDDKHLMKLAAHRHGVPTADWRILRRGTDLAVVDPFKAARYIIKPNASSASWGIGVSESWAGALDHAAHLHTAGHDAIIEPWLPLLDVAVPVVGGRSPEPWLLPAMAYIPADPEALRSYEEKRALTEQRDDPLEVLANSRVAQRLYAMTRTLCRELWPFDYGRFEFRYDPASESVWFMEVNLSCNLWSKKSISRSAATLGIEHHELVESIVAHSLWRQGLITAASDRLVA
ncbi:phosphoribosylglycinamide synthetase [Sphingosinicella soli]|uniref:D-alanine-D-alanine ligase n=1 Tax=Sphingosinicella soli TaxID=333708 RepID=A0A7W7FAF7_9SPHN|nr:phosphoribosylglycinamide synthetase [Sphingosinicella soli]MBB4633638.1 D-alanine-D-alanine ligase [Sphingosinicella soli]